MMKLITCFILIFFASWMLIIFFWFNEWMDGDSDEFFIEEIFRDIFGVDSKKNRR